MTSASPRKPSLPSLKTKSSAKKPAKDKSPAARFTRAALEVERLQEELQRCQAWKDRALQAFMREVMPIGSRLAEEHLQMDALLQRALESNLFPKRLKAKIFAFAEDTLTALEVRFGKNMAERREALHRLDPRSRREKERDEKARAAEEEFEAFARMLSGMAPGEFGQVRKGESTQQMFDEMLRTVRAKGAGGGSPDPAAAADENTVFAESPRSRAQRLKREAKERDERERLETDFRALYLQLARNFHPDKEADPELRQAKAEWMKKLTQVYQDKDFFTLVKMLAAHPFQAEGAAGALALTEKTTLQSYIRLFEEQKKLLRQEIDALTLMPPVVRYLAALAHPDRFEAVHRKVKAEAQREYRAYREMREICETPEGLREATEMHAEIME